MGSVLKMTVEGLKTIFDWIAVILLFLTFAAGVGVLITGNIINERQEQQLREFDKDLTGAKTELGKQQERAANADARVAGLEKDAADAKTEMAKQQERAAVAERNLLELQQKIKWRSVAADQRNKFLAAVAHIKKGTVQITTASGDPEAINFSNELRALLKEGGYSVPVVDIVPLLYPQFAIGLSLVIQSSVPLNTSALDPRQVVILGTSPIAHGLPLGAALDAAGFVIPKERISREHTKDEVLLLVGHKP